MPVDCQRSTSGGKGNFGRFTERDSRICAAGLPTAQPDLSIREAFDQYLLKDEVDALLGDAIIPPPKSRPPPPRRRPPPPDTRNAGFMTQVGGLINPPPKTKFQCVVEDIKETSYASYWKKPLGKSPDPTPMLPAGFDFEGKTFGVCFNVKDSLYDFVLPKNPLPDETPDNRKCGTQLNRKYNLPFNRDLIYGLRTKVDPQGGLVKCCLTDDNVKKGISEICVVSKTQADFVKKHTSQMGTGLAPNNNIECVPDGHSFGIISNPTTAAECFTTCKLNPNRSNFLKYLEHLNSLRKFLATRYLPTFFRTMWRSLKYLDKDKSGWLPKETVYEYCGTKYIRFDPSLIEPLLKMWNAFDGSKIYYELFCEILNYKLPIPVLPKVQDYPPECFEFSTTYREMTKPGQEEDKRKMAGVPSGRYLDRDYPVTPAFHCKADNSYLMQESTVRSVLNPSIMSLHTVSHRDMFAAREPHVVRRVFEASGEKFTDESFNVVWEEAKKYHSQGLVCYETFRKALEGKLEGKT